MRLLLKEDVDGLGFCGDEVEVKDGYGRNFLIPKGKALLATPNSLKAFNHQKRIVQAKVKKVTAIAQGVADEIGKATLQTRKKVGEGGKMFGSVTAQEISDLLKNKYPDVVWLVDAVSSMAGIKIEVDRLGIDFLLSSTQKAWGLPAGFSICSISDKMIKKSSKLINKES